MEIKQPFYAGQTFSYGGVDYNIEKGNRRPGDLRLKFLVRGGGWHTPHIAHTLICIAVKSQVENNNYPPPGKGQKKLMKAIEWSIADRMQLMIDKIEEEVAARKALR